MTGPRKAARTALAMGLLLALPLAGCIGPAGSGQRGHLTYGPKDATGAPTSAAVRSCTLNSVQAPVPWTPVAEALPAGFEPVPYLGDERHRDRHAGLIADVYSCREGSVGDRPRGPLTGMAAKLRVDPPDRYLDDDIDEGAYWILLVLLVDDEERADAMRSWGFPAFTGTPEIGRMGPGPVDAVEADGAGGGLDVRIRTTLAAPDDLIIGGERSRYFGLTGPLFGDDRPEVRSVVERSTVSTRGMAGQGDVGLGGDGLPESMHTEATPGLGFDTAAHDYGWTYRVQTLR